MASEILRPENQESPPASTPEVELALVLSRMIDSVQNDPEHLRQTIYELARHKLEEQFASESRGDLWQLSRALETAIQGVESFVKKNDQPVLGTEQAVLPSPRSFAHPRNRDEWTAGERVPAFLEAQTVVEPTIVRRSSWFPTLWRLVLVLAIALAAVATLQRGVTIESFRTNLNLPGSPKPSPSNAVALTPQAIPSPHQTTLPEPSPLLPTAYGIYAVSADKLYELELLPGKAPDMRVAISPLITSSSRTTLPDGHVKFIVYRRDSATSAADHAEIRIVAKIEHEVTFDKAGKPVLSKTEDGWVMRNISMPYRTAPKKDDPDMYEIQSEDPGQPLAPGRYALVLKGQSYDFTVAGPITDLRHCLERMAAINGQFYSECQTK